ncbi:UDP-2,3-diacylglucosamine diphosphatase [Paucibacter sp. APW11]|uniref:UDP-2,3-diacylglucosamine hydrolase n=1 Tax=Roseateles aquae TaxID=3077235 RepID=A0ABU3P9B5_9BURK|nr:UDP-2,3-diacylglucosamine diphosphatase [Paucibacter sp. APW11]MDT8999162.1 UDP-2,3-diacylglucosamine diphosphatase [Paucibacter sp. APW11]
MKSRPDDASGAAAAATPLIAPPSWRAIDFLSDLHLSPSTPGTLAALRRWLASTDADAVFLLGDIFEVWVGDDARHDDFEAACVALLGSASQRLSLFFMAGNRDFLLGRDMAEACGLQLLSDPCCLHAFGRRLLLSHGDALCLADSGYQAFRQQVRSASWQHDFLSRPLSERHDIARQLREGSRLKQQQQGPELWAEPDTEACLAALREADAELLLHGHTHRPAIHQLDRQRQRWVLSDWDFDAAAPRGDVLRLDAAGLRRLSVS